ncbi:preprotein translocase subunit YajC [Spirochaeta africana]|uniref:Sec translocon accessory complex subunit YajC n=1 Tax=Spirochaeta africana (strain ATCC 700263 / DSM 8902 / Z-7692) TaxID=889378 RepID=H9UFL7_SPIAZ|nr:preprotein translocase subunit YajC [Spirochaeta africana]AFG36310.1 preprotein translocase, YajC subunit [Spirochaeta africana DSM 8902]
MGQNLFSLPLFQAAAPAAGAQGGGQLMMTVVTFGLVFLIFYFLILRPQNKRQKQQTQMQESLKKGDKVVTIGGIRGVIVTVKEDSVVLKVDENAKMEFNRSAISSVLNSKENSENA